MSFCKGRIGKIYGIRSYHGCYDVLSYPFFFPRSELGCHTDILKEGVSYDAVLTTRAARKARGDDDSGYCPKSWVLALSSL
uniref:Uncharacterized protein n=1 Tax=Arundo donax TaxID=35708 RepID=A0A0A9BVW8_ARUDO